MQFEALKRSGECCSDADRTATPRNDSRQQKRQTPKMSFDQVVDLMRCSQWCGCGAVPGANLTPSSTCCNVPDENRGRPKRAIRPPTLPGYGIGAHGLELGATAGLPNTSAGYPLIWQLPDSSVNLDPMDPNNMWNPPTTSYDGRTDPWAPWGYALGPKV